MDNGTREEIPPMTGDLEAAYRRPHTAPETTEVCASLLEYLASSPKGRAHLVTVLMDAAGLLDGSIECDAQRRQRGVSVHARALRDLAASLCDHASTAGAHCRDCDVVLPTARYGEATG